MMPFYKTKVNIFWIFIFTLRSSVLFSQSASFRKNTITAELPSYVCNYSLNYERVIREKKWITVAKVGIYYEPARQTKAGIKNEAKDNNALLVGIDFYRSFKRHFFSIGSGLASVREIDWTKQPTKAGGIPYRYAVVYIPRVGYRYQKKPKGLSFRVMLTPFQTDITPRTPTDQVNKNYFVFQPVYPYLGSLGVGYSF